ncbi:putative acetate regulatory dna binding protein [Phaeomoniella chlamydospora]|uniref:Putative acetate regulatory dna binding protein n=1 Tax=Phaeomoniella chlamydospora TaxID=158046 RepID=A0A0G2EG80_PHACM|nr:putative acetate regulatory dna binding protein [Phaeomoniella chlamydospora]
MRPSHVGTLSPKTVSRAPPRLLSDQYINVFFQEWSPLFPILDHASFLKTYQDFLADPESPQWQNRKHDIAQLYLVFDVASVSLRASTKLNGTSYEQEWRRAMQAMSSAPSLMTLKCHILAQLLYLLKDEQKYFLRHRASGVTMCHQLSLHLSQDARTLPYAEKESRKVVFWSQYILDRFGASASDVPVLLRESDISLEMPENNVEEVGSSPVQGNQTKGESKVSNFLALIQITRILSKVLDQLHPASTKFNLSINNVSALTEEVDKWVSSLPSHLKVKFAADKPSTGIVSDRSPLLSLAELYIRMLINRPLVCFGSGSTASTAVLTSANIAKQIAQLCDLLDERNMNYTFPLNKTNLLLTAGFALLWQAIELSPESKLVKDNQKSLALITRMLYRESEVVATEFAKVMGSIVGIPPNTALTPANNLDGVNTSAKSMQAPSPSQKSTRKHLQAIAARFSVSSFGNRPKAHDVQPQRAISTSIDQQPQFNPDQFNHEQINSDRASISSEPAFPALTPTTSRDSNRSGRQVNLDFFPLGNDSAATLPNLPLKDPSNTATWEQLLASIDSGDLNIFNGIYGGMPSSEAFSLQSMDGPVNVSDVDPCALSGASAASAPDFVDPHAQGLLDLNNSTWPNESWPAALTTNNSVVDLNDIHQAVQQQQQRQAQSHHIPQSVTSYVSEEDSIPSSGGDDFTSLAGSFSNGSVYNGSSRRTGTSVSSVGSSHKPQQSDLCPQHFDNSVGEESAYGAIVIPNEYGIGF